MRIGARYSHLNGEEYLLVHHPQLLREVEGVIAEVDAESCRTKVSRGTENPGASTLRSEGHERCIQERT